MITGIAHTALIVLEYGEAIEFYCGKLGFIVAEDTQLKNKRWVRLRAPGGKGSEILLSRAVDDTQRACIVAIAAALDLIPQAQLFPGLPRWTLCRNGPSNSWDCSQ